MSSISMNSIHFLISQIFDITPHPAIYCCEINYLMLFTHYESNQQFLHKYENNGMMKSQIVIKINH